MLNIRRISLTILISMVTFIAANTSAQNADEALVLLKEGNARFAAMKMQHPNVSAERRVDTAMDGQNPFAAVLACSDSREPVEAIFDRGIGDIFVVRVAGNIATDPSVIGSIEYAAEHLNTPLIIVIGHTECGAVKAAVSGPPMEEDIRTIQKTIEAVVAKVKKDHPSLQGDGLAYAVVKENVLQSIEDILSKSEEIKRMVKEGKLKILPAVYDLKTGIVEWI